jgi:uncharacterized protein
MPKYHMNKIKKMLWFVTGLALLGVAYLGVVIPGIPWSTPTVAAAFCFARSNSVWHAWLMNHPLFGTFLTQWSTYRVFPNKAKWMMVLSMDASLIIIYVTTGNIWFTVAVGMVMLITSVWCWRYPNSAEEARQRIAQGMPLGWFR